MKGKCTGWLGPSRPSTFTLFYVFVIYAYIAKCDLFLSTCIPVWVQADPLCEVVRFHFPALDFGLVFPPGPSRRNKPALVHVGMLFIFYSSIRLVFRVWSKQEKWTYTSARSCDAANLFSLLPVVFLLSLNNSWQDKLYGLFLYFRTLLKLETFIFYVCNFISQYNNTCSN